MERQRKRERESPLRLSFSLAFYSTQSQSLSRDHIPCPTSSCLHIDCLIFTRCLLVLQVGGANFHRRAVVEEPFGRRWNQGRNRLIVSPHRFLSASIALHCTLVLTGPFKFLLPPPSLTAPNLFLSQETTRSTFSPTNIQSQCLRPSDILLHGTFPSSSPIPLPSSPLLLPFLLLQSMHPSVLCRKLTCPSFAPLQASRPSLRLQSRGHGQLFELEPPRRPAFP